MKKISIEESLDLYLTTLSNLDEKYVHGSDEALEYFIYDELDINAHTFLHNYTVNLLVEGNLIPESALVDSENLRTLIRDLIDKNPSLEVIRYDPEWQKARQLAAKILSDIQVFNRRM